MSESQFLKQADTGDILLFRGSQAGGLLTRTFTASDWDHVAMVLKFPEDQNEIYLVEAVGELGVRLNKWDNLRDHVGEDKFYHKIALRHVNFDRTDQMCDTLETLLKEVIGLEYSLSASKLTKQKSIKIQEGGLNTLIERDRSFFCSELIAKAFKCLGIILDDEIACS